MHFVEQFDEQFVLAEGFLAPLGEVGIDSGVHALKVCHERTHHTTGQATAYEQRCHLGVTRIDPIAQEVVNKGLRQAACLHISIHIDVLNEEACITQHRLHGDDIGMHHTPAERLHGNIQHIDTCLGYLEHGGNRKAGT